MKNIALLSMTVLLSAVSLQAQSTYQSKLSISSHKGASIMGIVEANGRPVSNVVVSDGYETTVTDRNGRYWLKSQKQNGQVFVSIPSGYEATSQDVVPAFWADLTAAPNVVERHDFALQKVDNSKHAVVVITDPHFTNSHHDVTTFTESCMPKINSAVEQFKAEGTPVFTLCLGDASWDRFWYDNDFQISDFRKLLNQIHYPTSLFNVMGNHDNDGSVAAGDSTDFLSAKPYMKAFGPRYYSFNAGGLHYVVLDDIVYHNEGKPRFGNGGIAGSCNYEGYFTQEQLDWLKKDLAYVADKETPIIIATHIPVFRNKEGLGKEYTHGLKNGSTQALMDIVNGYKTVHILTGHTHYNMICRIDNNGNEIVEHNIAGTCGNWWNTSACGYKVYCPDGRPAGFAMFTANGKDIEWEFNAYESDKQFTTYDINSVRDYYANNAELQIFHKHYPKWDDFSKAPDNQVYIDVWAWDPNWTITVTENGRKLPVKHTSLTSPTYQNTYMLSKTVWNENYPDSYQKPRKVAIFSVIASAPDTPLEITVTDTFGHVYTETMQRPKAFNHTTW
jgi:hypothetical protein